jgi:hypothetical protein
VGGAWHPDRDISYTRASSSHKVLEEDDTVVLGASIDTMASVYGLNACQIRMDPLLQLFLLI